MKNLIILIALAISIPAISAEVKDYKYKDISTKQALPVDGVGQEKSIEKKSPSAEFRDEADLQKQEEYLERRETKKIDRTEM